MKTPFTFCLPASFRPAEFLRTPQLIRLADDARYFVSLILTKTSRGQVDELGYVRLMAKHLRNVMHKHHYHQVVDSLLESGAVVRAPYQVGEQSFGYRLGDRFRDDKHIRITVRDTRLIDRLRSFHEQADKERQSRMKPVHYALELHQQRLSIDGKQATEIIEALPPASNPWDCQGILVRDIQEKVFHVNVGRYGRVSNNITSMKREIRPALRLGQEPLQHVDISCSQPALIGRAAKQAEQHPAREQNQIKEENKRESIYDALDSPLYSRDVGVYCELVQSGQFYDFMLSNSKTGQCPNLTREDLKKRFLTDVVAKRKASRHGAEYPSNIEDRFRELFPSVYKFIRDINCDGWEHENLIRQLQQQESELVIETVAANLIANHPRMFVLTLHDAIYTTASGIPVVIGAFKAAFEQIDYPMTLKVA